VSEKRGDLDRREIRLPDGRRLIYYSFPGAPSEPEPPLPRGPENPSAPVDPRGPEGR
jgi:hypothetical protein